MIKEKRIILGKLFHKCLQLGGSYPTVLFPLINIKWNSGLNRQQVFCVLIVLHHYNG